MKIVVLGGGISTERHVALVTATSACQALRRRGHQAVFVDLFFGMENYDKPLELAFDEPDGLCGKVAIETEAPDLEAIRRSRRLESNGNLGSGVAEICSLADCVFLGLHGRDGEDGKIQALLELIGVPYTGSGPLASAIAMDKDTAKRILKAAGVRTPVWQVHSIPAAPEALRHLAETLPVPCVVKVYDGGSSLGVKFPTSHEEMHEALREISHYGSRVLVEEKINGRELTVPVLDGRALSPIEVIPPEGKEFDYVSKYQSGAQGAREICPASLTEEEENNLRAAAEQVHAVLDLRVYSRSDFILDEKGRVWFLEVNTLPGMTPNSLIPKAAAVEGMSYDELVEKIVLLSLRENRS
ncbi:MAG: D-alanine--D-alanine ligase [Oscillospiraceae bacterium]|jgi:D-alanine-D-alanine ligase|nr:D-alanine--D-alanine ligase [Oscillospiraceae bacterium]MBQ1577723.1 D-alanine--D-alanine ligase [Oscillospiraceae bacterium]MBQ1792204.1 D-alanine--D-alanine ligase [Oscillospiraceae bacterium]MBQ2072051.1 D-alanine--D-alanine ligase [Oscillospiraceae bacterium]MBQ4017119.1 D-alanine--D-alanine ligase [Oscillospiraceae bacterium]